MRLDAYLTAFGFAASRTRAKNLIESGRVGVDGKNVTKPAFDVPENAVVTLAETDEEEFVGRGGKKLAAALEQFGISVSGRICADIGASTAGFTDCLLRRGAARVYAVDSGSGQLVPELAEDSRVVSLENTNARYIDANTFGGVRVSLAVMDVSFISQKLLYPALCAITEPNADIVTLVKPQFEAGREKVGKKGVVRDPKVHEEVIEKVRDYAMSIFMEPCHLSFSPIKGPEGNIEYLLHLKKHPEGTEVPVSLDVSVEDVVKEAHGQLD